MDRKKPTARVARDGYIQVAITEPPGCLARLGAWLRAAAIWSLVFGAGVLFGWVWAWLS